MRLFPQERHCRCGKSWGRYLDDRATTIQTWPSLSIGLANPDFVAAERAFAADPDAFSPMLTIRAWINPATEPDVTFAPDTAPPLNPSHVRSRPTLYRAPDLSQVSVTCPRFASDGDK